MVHKALLTPVSSACVSNAGSYNNEMILLLLLLQTLLMLKLLLAKSMPLMLVERSLACTIRNILDRCCSRTMYKVFACAVCCQV